MIDCFTNASSSPLFESRWRIELPQSRKCLISWTAGRIDLNQLLLWIIPGRNNHVFIVFVLTTMTSEEAAQNSSCNRRVSESLAPMYVMSLLLFRLLIILSDSLELCQSFLHHQSPNFIPVCFDRWRVCRRIRAWMSQNGRRQTSTQVRVSSS